MSQEMQQQIRTLHAELNTMREMFNAQLQDLIGTKMALKLLHHEHETLKNTYQIASEKLQEMTNKMESSISEQSSEQNAAQSE